MDTTPKPLRLPIDYLTLLLSIFSMIAGTIVFAYSNFETKAEAERDRTEVSRSVKDLHDDLQELRREMNAKLDRLIRDQK